MLAFSGYARAGSSDTVSSPGRAHREGARTASRQAIDSVSPYNMGSPLAKPARIGKYDVTGVIGRGGMGIVYRATDPRIGRPVAIKVLTGLFSEDSELLERFYREAKSTGSLQHQNIVTVYELGDQDGFPYLVMEYLEGESLDSIIASRRPLSIAEKLGIIIRVCDGLSFAHARGIIHRDIKPANIVVLKSGAVKIVDFGIAQVGGNRLTRTGQIVGSIYYMSPEQLNDSGLASRLLRVSNSARSRAAIGPLHRWQRFPGTLTARLQQPGQGAAVPLSRRPPGRAV
jgi:serine/threonine protein kinase